MDLEAYRVPFEKFDYKEQLVEYSNECYLRDTGIDTRYCTKLTYTVLVQSFRANRILYIERCPT